MIRKPRTKRLSGRQKGALWLLENLPATKHYNSLADCFRYGPFRYRQQLDAALEGLAQSGYVRLTRRTKLISTITLTQAGSDAARRVRPIQVAPFLDRRAIEVLERSSR